MVVLRSELYSSVSESDYRYDPLEDGILSKSDGSIFADNLIEDRVGFDVAEIEFGHPIFHGILGAVPDHSDLGLEGEVHPTVEEEEDGVGDRELGVAHESLQVVVDGVVAVLHAVVVGLVEGRDVVSEKSVGLFEEGVGVLKMGQNFVVGIGSGLCKASFHGCSFFAADPMQVFDFASKESVQLMLIQRTYADCTPGGY